MCFRHLSLYCVCAIFCEDGEYMSFGLSGDDNRSVMVGGDVVVAWVDQNTLNGYAHDYYLDAKSQCSGTQGSCPDFRIEGNTESVRLLNAALVNGYSIVTYQRPLKSHDGLDLPIFTNGSQPVIWAVGPLNSKQEVSYHSITSKGDVFIDFGRPPHWNCPIPETDSTTEAPHKEDLAQHESIQNSRQQQQQITSAPSSYKTPPTPAPASKKDAWDIPPIQCNEPEDGVFYAQMGPTGGKRGYSAITGHVGWGISYYINGLLIPEINVVRGRTYTFVVEGGRDSNTPAKFHPFYITDDPVGGYQHKTPEERRKVNIYAGAELNKVGDVVPTGLGRLCNWTPDPEHPSGDDFGSFGAYQRTLTLVCDHGEPAVVQWTPDKDTPDTVYYQCFVHRYLGWKIRVHDRCDLPSGSGSEPVPSIAYPDDELQAKPSILVTTRVKPDFPQQSISDTKTKNFTKMQFPYEIVKPAYNVKHQNGSDSHVIPVKEDTEDMPDTTTLRVYTNFSTPVMPVDTAMPLIKIQSSPPRGPMRGPPNRRPVVMVRRPVQVLKPHVKFISRHPGPMMHVAASQNRPIVVKKPLVRLPQRPVVMGPAHQFPVMGPMMQAGSMSRPLKPIYVHKFKKPLGPLVTQHTPDKIKHKHVPSVPNMNPSPMISQSTEESTANMPIAVNTGFNPGSLVIESGFQPIIQSPQSQPSAEERVSEVEYDNDDNDEGVIHVESLDEQKSQTEMFEPMFIPSPLDSNVKHVKKATTEPLKKSRKPVRHIILRRPVYNDEPLFRSEPDDEPDLPYALPLVDESPLSTTDNVDSETTIASIQPSDAVKVDEVSQVDKNSTRSRRSPNHEPGHEGTVEEHEHYSHDDSHDHHNHDHHNHDHSGSNQKANSSPLVLPLFPLISLSILHFFIN